MSFEKRDIHRPTYSFDSKKPLYLRGKKDLILVAVIIERLSSDPVPCEDRLLSMSVIKAKGIFAFKKTKNIKSVGKIALENYLLIGRSVDYSRHRAYT